jgi:transposase-like protein
MRKHKRPRRNSNQWQEIIAQQKSSGESVAVYCREQDLCEKSFYAWRRRLGKRTGAKLKDFIKVTIPAKTDKESIHIKTPGGYCLEVPEGTDSSFVKNIIAVLVSQ